MDEEKRKEILETRERHKKLTKQILAGKRLSETIQVDTIWNEKMDIDVHALGEGEIMDCYVEAGVNEKQTRNPFDNMKVQRIVAAKAISTEKEQWSALELGKILKIGEAAKISNKCLTLSGAVDITKEIVRKFRKESVSNGSGTSNN